MNLDTGKIEYIFDLTEREAKARRLVEIHPDLLTEKQKLERIVRADNSDAGKVLAAARNMERSRYQPHVGAKQLAKMERRKP